MNLRSLTSVLSAACGLCLAAGIALATTGCSTVAQAGLDYATRKVIEGSGASLPLDGSTVGLTAHIEKQATPSGSGVLVVRVKAEGGWPKDWHPTQFSFRPQGASQSFNFVEIAADGGLLRAIGRDALQPGFEAAASTRTIRLRIAAVSELPYELLVTLRNPDGRRANLALQSIAAR